MAKLSAIENNNRRKKLVASKWKTRQALKDIIRNKETSFEDRMNAVMRLSEMPRNSSSTRVRNRCALSGRPRGFYKKFGMSRIAIRELASRGLIPGLVKSSW